MRIDGQRQVVGHARKFFRFFPGVVQVADEVAQVGGLFEVVRGGGFFISAFELTLHFAALTFEEIARGLDLFEILFARDIADARRGAVFQMRVEAMFVVRLARREHAAAAQIKLPLREREESVRVRRALTNGPK